MTDKTSAAAETAGQSLDELRQAIDSLDRDVLSLISQRARLAAAVRGAKSGDADNTGKLLYRPEREAQVLRRVLENNPGPLGDDVLVRLYREIMSACLAQQEPLKIAYLGPEGTFTQQAVQRQFGQSVHAVGQATIEGVFLEVQRQQADFGVVPVENSSQGIVSHTLDLFLDYDLNICGEVELRIHHHLLTHARSLDAIERVYSHQQSLGQCRSWLRRQLPDAELIAVPSNSEAARRVRNMPDAAAIASRAAGEVYGLPTLFGEIEDAADNTTRFLVIGRSLFAPSGEDKTTLLLAGDDGPGALFSLLKPLADNGINMSRIESRPSRVGRWNYVFFIDVDGHADEPPLAEAVEALQAGTRLCRVLGAYPKAIHPEDSTPAASPTADSQP